MSRLCSGKLEQYGRALLLDLHSYAAHSLPYELHKDDVRPEICVGHNGDPASMRIVDRITPILLDAGYVVGVNKTFSGAITPNNVNDPRLASIMIEVRKDQYLHDNGKLDIRGARKLTDALTAAFGW